MRSNQTLKKTRRSLLETRLCELKVGLPPTVIRQVARIEQRLESRGIQLRFQVWISDEFFSPDGTIGFAVPFYLCDPELTALERNQMHRAEGSRTAECFRILKHEAGHAFLSAFDLRRHPLLTEAFGDFHRPYPRHYVPKPYSRQFVRNLAPGYAQAHPDEDFAETFAVWLRSPRLWRRMYSSGPARQKLEAIETVARSLRGRSPRIGLQPPLGELGTLRTKLSEHYAKRRAHYGIETRHYFDRALKRAFTDTSPKRSAVTADQFLRKIEDELVTALVEKTGRPRYEFRAVLERARRRTRELELSAPQRVSRFPIRSTRILMRLLANEQFRIAV